MTESSQAVRDLQHSDDVIVLLREQHERIKQLFRQVSQAPAADRGARFDELRALLAVHETAEEMILRPVTATDIGKDIADARNAEEKEATEQLAELEKLGPDDPAFEPAFARFEADVLRHAQNEESLEFPRVLAVKDAQERARLGKAVRSAEAMAPTHPHPGVAGSPSAQLLTGPFASMLDRVRDAMKRS
jgi:Hemerythrin HHE cation binding domain